MYLVKMPYWLRRLYNANLIWRIEGSTNEIFLTFDDGPHPIATPFVLQQLKDFNASATFFCIGKNVADHPAIFQQVKDAGHAVGNHTHNHLNGWKVPTGEYIKNVHLAQEFIHSRLFRPPYGRISRAQVKLLQPSFSIIMWDVLSGDFDETLTGEECLNNVLNNLLPGSIVVFHDSEKAFPRLQYALPKVLEYCTNRYKLCALQSSDQ